MSFVTIAPSQVDRFSPIDEQLMQTIKADLDYLYAQQLGMQTFDYQFKVNGYLNNIPTVKLRRIDGSWIAKDQTFQKCNFTLEEPGDGGTMEIDIRAYSEPNVQITSLLRKFSSAINSIARVGSSLNTQSVTRSTAQIATQSITQWKATTNIQSIVPLGSNLFRYNLDTQPDSDWIVGNQVVIAGCGSSANNGTYSIVRVNDDGGKNIVISNASGVVQSGTGGTVILAAWSYNYSNPVSTEFAAGELGHFTGHADSGNNGDFAIYAINQAGNNIIVKNATGVAHGGSGGNADTNRWIYALSSSAPSDYVIGEKALMASHTDARDDGKLKITAVNQGGNNIIAYNPAGGVVQGGAAGTINTLRWLYFFSSNPGSTFTAGDTAFVSGATDPNDNGSFVVKQVNRSTSDNVVIYNEFGVAQGGAGGTLVHTNMIATFASDQSATITTASKVNIYGTPQNLADGDFQVLEVNRGGGSNFNIVIDSTTGVEAVGNCGRVTLESKSLFDTRPTLTINPISTNFNNTHLRLSSNAVFNNVRKTVVANTRILMDITSLPSGRPKNLTVQLL